MKNNKFKSLLFAAIMLTACCATACAQKQRKVGKQPTTQQKVENDSVSILTKEAEAGNAVSQNTLGTWFYTGKNVKQDYAKALEWWSKAAEKGNTDAVANMAMCYQLGNGARKDSIMALKLYKAAVQKGNKAVVAQHEKLATDSGNTFSSMLLYELYFNSIGVKQDKAKAAAFLETVAKAGNTDAQYKLALCHLNDNKPDKAADWFRQAAEKGDARATYYYGWLMHQGRGTVQDKARGIALMQKASEKGVTAADYQLGKIFLEGNGTEQDYAKAANHLKKAANGNADAQWLLGLCYLRGQGVEQDYYLATQYLAEASRSHGKEFNELLKEDNEGPFSQYLLGLKEYYVIKDYDKALELFKKVAKAKIAEGETMMGVIIANKNYGKRNPKKAVKTLTKAADKSAAAKYYLSAMYESGTGVKKDKAKALELLQKAADEGIAYAQCKLGDKYMDGSGVPQDYVRAVQLYIMAEAQHHLTPQSAKNLAKCYEMQIATLPDLKDAKKRIEKLNNTKQNDRLMAVLQAISK